MHKLLTSAACFLLFYGSCLAQGTQRQAEANKIIDEASEAAKNEGRNCECVEIPLEQIAAYRMPGTQRIIGHVAKTNEDKTRVQNIRRRLGRFNSQDSPVVAFAVQGTGLDALNAAYGVLVDGNERQLSFPAGSDVTIVFYSVPMNVYVHIHKVTVQDRAITIRYRLVPHLTRELTAHLALIPVSGIADGEHHVGILMSPMKYEYIRAGFKPVAPAVAREFVCRSFSFVVSEQENSHRNTSTNAETVEIPLDQIWGLNIPDTRDISKLEPKHPSGLPNDALARISRVFSITRALGRMGAASKEKRMKPGFAVSGEDQQALEKAHQVLTGKSKPAKQLSQDKPVSLVFYTGLSGRYVHLDGVTRNGSDIVIRYHFVAHSSFDMSRHLALIPLGVLPQGKYQVTFIKGPPMTNERLVSLHEFTPNQVEKIVCQPFEFVATPSRRFSTSPSSEQSSSRLAQGVNQHAAKRPSSRAFCFFPSLSED